jgi:MerR family copper efflux transcriptional regulator
MDQITAEEVSYRIGELAQKAGVTVRTIRYYEELGILESSDHRGARHRRYGDRDLVRLRRVQQLKGYGLSLGEIREIFELSREDPTGEKSRLRLLSRYRQKHREAEERKQRLEAYLAELDWHIEQLRKVGDFQACPGEECLSCGYTMLCKFYNRSNPDRAQEDRR